MSKIKRLLPDDFDTDDYISDTIYREYIDNLIRQQVINESEIENINARYKLLDAIEQEKAQREWEIEKALKDATILQLLGEIERRDDE